MGHSSPAPLLPLLLQPPSQYRRQGMRRYAVGTGRRPHAALLRPAKKLAERAVQLQSLYALEPVGVNKLSRQIPGLVFKLDPQTQRLKLTLLQGRLLGDERRGDGDHLAPEMLKMLRRCPKVGGFGLWLRGSRHRGCEPHKACDLRLCACARDLWLCDLWVCDPWFCVLRLAVGTASNKEVT